MLNKAIKLVNALFCDKVDKGGNPYVNHLFSVANMLDDEVDKTIAILHDVIEDTDLNANQLCDLGFIDEVVIAVFILSKREDETYNQYILRIKNSGNERVKRVKKADLRDNMNLDRIPNVTQRDINRVVKRYLPAFIELMEDN